MRGCQLRALSAKTVAHVCMFSQEPRTEQPNVMHICMYLYQQDLNGPIVSGTKTTEYGSEAFTYDIANDTLNDHELCLNDGKWCPDGLFNLAPCYFSKFCSQYIKLSHHMMWWESLTPLQDVGRQFSKVLLLLSQAEKLFSFLWVSIMSWWRMEELVKVRAEEVSWILKLLKSW